MAIVDPTTGAVLVLGGPAGPPGPASTIPGPASTIPGPAGPVGQPGSPGQNAFQIWQAAGNTGTVNDFIASLKGQKGDQGAGTTIKGAVVSYADLPTAGMSMSDVYLMQSAGTDPQGQAYQPGDGYVYKGGTPPWQYVGPIRGPKGDAGTTTASGLTDVVADLKTVLRSADLTTARSAFGLGNVATVNASSSGRKAVEQGDGSDLTALPLGVGAIPRRLAAKLAELASTGLDFGAVEDGIADDTSKLIAGLNSVAQSTRNFMLQSRMYCNDVITVPAGVTFGGTSTAMEDGVNHDPAAQRGVIIAGPNFQIRVGNGARVKGLYIIRSDVATPATSEAQMLSRVAAYSGTAITVVGLDAMIEDNFIMGFNQAIYASGFFRPLIRRNQIDCTNGIEVTNCLDIARVEDNECFPFYTTNQPNISIKFNITQRSGKAFYLHDTVDGAFVRGNFAYGWRTSFHMHSLYCVKVIDNTCDNAIGEMNGNIGFLTSGAINSMQFSGNHADSHYIGFDFQHQFGSVVGGSNGAGQNQKAHVRFGANSVASFGAWSLGGPTSDALIEFVPGVLDVNIGSVLAHTGTRTGNAYIFSQADVSKIRIGRTQSPGGQTIDNLNPATDVEVTAATNQNVPAAANTLVQFGTVVRDAQSEFGTSQNGFYPKVAGRYTFEVTLGYSAGSATSNQVNIMLFKNGAAVERIYTITTSNIGFQSFGRSMTIDLALGDAVQVVAYFGQGATIDAVTTKMKVRPVR